MQNRIILDIATASIVDADGYLDGVVRAPSNYKDQAKIDEYIREKQAERLAMAGTDIDLARVTGVGLTTEEDGILVKVARDERDECAVLAELALVLTARPIIITFGGLNFDLPLLMRRARYLGVKFPTISLDRFKSPHIDLCELLSDRNPQRRRSLDFYVKRLGWKDLDPKPMSGADESRVHDTGQWDLLEKSIRRDVAACYRLACWLDVIEPEPVMEPEQIEVGF